jgi:hypothetical protein
MMLIIKAIKFIIIIILSVIYWPINTAFLWVQSHYRKWQKEDMVSFIVATPLYYLFFLVVVILSIPIEFLGEEAHPQISIFR